MTSRTIHSARRLAAVALLAVTSCLVLNTAPSVAALRRPGTTAPDCGPRIKKNALTAWKCTFADDFSGTSLDAAKWQAITTAANGQTAGAACFLRSAHNISVHDGALHLTARQEAGRFTCASPKG